MSDSDNNNILNKNQKSKQKLLWYFVITVVIVISIGIYANYWLNNQSVERVEFKGNKLISGKELSIGLEKSLGDSSRGSYSLDSIQKKVEQHPYIEKTVAVHKDVKVIKIDVTERILNAIVIDEFGNLSYTDKTGKILPYRLFSEVNDLPIIKGVYKANILDTVHFKGCLKILGMLESDNYLILNELISEIVYNNDCFTYELIGSNDGTKIIIGNTNNLDSKLRKLVTFLVDNPYENSGNINNYIDLRWKNQVVIK
jgi:hypothetical protein